MEAESIDNTLSKHVVAAFLLAAGTLLGTIPLSTLIFKTQLRASQAGYSGLISAYNGGFRWPIITLIICAIVVIALYIIQIRNAWQAHLQIGANSDQSMAKIAVFLLCGLGCIGPIVVFYLMSILLRP